MKFEKSIGERYRSMCDAHMICLMLLISLPSHTGCSDANTHTYEISANVTLDGQPVPYGSVTFSSTEKKSNSVSPIDEQGHYRIEVIESKHLVAVAGRPPLISDKIDNRFEGGIPPGARRQSGPVVPARYSDLSTSGLTFTVSADGPREFNIKLH